VLHLLNSERVDSKLRHDGGRVAELVRRETSDQRLVEELYLGALSRYPTDTERQTGVEYLSAAAPDDLSQRRARAEDLLWTLLNSLEFVFNH
jgi:hypothetical protein